MTDLRQQREKRRKRRVRNQVISYSVAAVMLVAVLAGAFFGVRAAGNALREWREARKASIQAAMESSMAAESAAAESAVEEMLSMEEETAAESESATEQYSPEQALEDMVADCIAAMSLEQKVAGLFIVTPEQITGVDQVVKAGDGTKEALSKYPVGGLVYFEQNLQSEDQVREMLSNTVSYSSFPIFLAVDEEGGTVERVADALQLESVGDMGEIGEGGDPSAARTAGEAIGTYLSDLGFNLDFAPVADVVTVEDSVIGDRSFGSDASQVSEMVAAAVEGIQGTGVSACLKHFPGLGSCTEDPHDGPSEVQRTGEEMAAAEFLPFQAGIAAGADMVMVGHMSVPSLTDGENVPASLSEEIVTGVLRTQLGYDGIVVTDAMDMTAITDYYETDVAAVMALRAGADMILMPEDFETAYQGVLDAVAEGTISLERIEDSLTRIFRVKYRNAVQWE